EICRRLDGLPLAIELAAARVKLLSAETILERLNSRLKVLVGGARNLPARQQTLRNAIEWSYDLLDLKEQALFRRLSVFAGGCTLEAVEVVAGDRQSSAESEQALIADSSFLIADSLIDKSLLSQVEQSNGAVRYSMLETIREYGIEQLSESKEEASIR